jgi:integrase
VLPLPPTPQAIGLYIVDLASEGRLGRRGGRSAATVERRLSGLAWNFRQRGTPLDCGDPHIKEVLASIRRAHRRPPAQKDALLAEDVVRMIGRLGYDLRGLRDRAILLLGFAGSLRRSEIVELDHGPDENGDGRGWVEVLEGGLVLHIREDWLAGGRSWARLDTPYVLSNRF